MGSLSGKVVVVTGSSSGIGRAVAEEASEAGAAVVVNSCSSVDEGSAVAEGLRDAVYVQGDVAHEPDAERIVAAAIDRWGRLDVLVNNAGTTVRIPHADVEAVTVASWERVLGVNVVGMWLMCQKALPYLQSSGAGKIINMGSLAGQICTGSSIPYAVSKAGVIHMSRLLSRVVGPDVTVNVVAPGFIETPWTAGRPATRQVVLESSPLARVGHVDDVVGAVMYLSSADYVTGEVISVDGGLQLMHTVSP
jgi:ketoreductase RED2